VFVRCLAVQLTRSEQTIPPLFKGGNVASTKRWLFSNEERNFHSSSLICNIKQLCPKKIKVAEAILKTKEKILQQLHPKKEQETE
jgi:L-lactate utilization protein LutB